MSPQLFVKVAATRSGNLEEKIEEGKKDRPGEEEGRRAGGREGKKEGGSRPASPQTERGVGGERGCGGVHLGGTGLLHHEFVDQPLHIHHRAEDSSTCF